MFVSCCLYNLSSLLPPIATAGIIAVVTENNFNGIWYYVLLYMIFYIMYFSMLHWNYHTYTVLANYYHLEVQKKLFEHVANNDSIFNSAGAFFRDSIILFSIVAILKSMPASYLIATR